MRHISIYWAYKQIERESSTANEFIPKDRPHAPSTSFEVARYYWMISVSGFNSRTPSDEELEPRGLTWILSKNLKCGRTLKNLGTFECYLIIVKGKGLAISCLVIIICWQWMVALLSSSRYRIPFAQKSVLYSPCILHTNVRRNEILTPYLRTLDTTPWFHRILWTKENMVSIS